MLSLRPAPALAAALFAAAPLWAETPAAAPTPEPAPQTAEAAAVDPQAELTRRSLVAFGWAVHRQTVLSNFNFSPEEWEAIITGMSMGNLGQELQITPEIMQTAEAILTAKANAKVEAMDAGEGSNDPAIIARAEENRVFLERLDQQEGIQKFPSGLRVEVIDPADGPLPTANEPVVLHYVGTLINGMVFDSSVERGEPATFSAAQVIPGFGEGIQQIPLGGKSRLYIPPAIGYGNRAAGEIPPGSLLIFEVEVLGLPQRGLTPGESQPAPTGPQP